MYHPSIPSLSTAAVVVVVNPPGWQDNPPDGGHLSLFLPSRSTLVVSPCVSE